MSDWKGDFDNYLKKQQEEEQERRRQAAAKARADEEARREASLTVTDRQMRAYQQRYKCKVCGKEGWPPTHQVKIGRQKVTKSRWEMGPPEPTMSNPTWTEDEDVFETIYHFHEPPQNWHLCSQCGGNLCGACSLTCSNCKRYFCSEHLHSGYCESCARNKMGGGN